MGARPARLCLTASAGLGWANSDRLDLPCPILRARSRPQLEAGIGSDGRIRLTPMRTSTLSLCAGP
eukprot:7667458-Alexandrium_andersonii.AAC.1